MLNFSPMWLLSQAWFVIHANFQLPVITVTAVICKNSKNSEKFELQISNIRIVHNLIQVLWVIHANFQFPVITVTAVICKKLKNSEKFELRISNIRIVENLTQDPWIIHAKFQPPRTTGVAVKPIDTPWQTELQLYIKICEFYKWNIEH